MFWRPKMIEVRGLSHSFDKNRVLKNVDFQVNDGKVVGLVGINGAGKSTLLRLLSGVYKIQSGTALYDGMTPDVASTRKDLFFLPDDPYYTVGSTCKTLFDLYKVLYPDADINIYKGIIDEFLLPWKKPIRSFSKGMRRQVFVALAFAVAPKYLLLDEAFDGLDPLARMKFKERISSLVREKNTTVIVSSHALKELEDFCDDYLLIDKGVIVSSSGVLEKKLNYAKFQLAFMDQISEEMFAGLPVKALKIVGRVATLTLENEDGSAEEALKRLNPVIIDKLDVSFEEAFINDVDRAIGSEGGDM